MSAEIEVYKGHLDYIVRTAGTNVFRPAARAFDSGDLISGAVQAAVGIPVRALCLPIYAFSAWQNTKYLDRVNFMGRDAFVFNFQRWADDFGR